MNRTIVVAVGAALVAAAAWAMWPRHGHKAQTVGNAGAAGSVASVEGTRGEALFNQRCAVCHGRNATGSAQGPPLVHRIYEPGHHSDMSFLLAVRRGVRAHHWRFGNMAPVPGLSEADVREIVRYVRALQRAKGIY
ncbi:MAG: cytochrome c [Deltaproteobacteria bacterium]|nr:cytochrome c [Deltaproteobacteria bacterium]